MKTQNKFFVAKKIKYWLTLESFYYSLLILMVGIFLLPKLAFLTSINDETIIELTNHERQIHGLSPLSANQLLTKAAYEKGNAIMASQEFKHSINGQKFSSWIKNAGYNYSYAGENLAIDFYTSEGAVKAWMNSPTHRQNILSDKFTEIGIAIIEDEFKGRSSTLIVQTFGSPLLLAPRANILGITETEKGIKILPAEKLPSNTAPISQTTLLTANIDNNYFGLTQINSQRASSLLSYIDSHLKSDTLAAANRHSLLQINYYIILILIILFLAFILRVRRRYIRTNKLGLSQ